MPPGKKPVARAPLLRRALGGLAAAVAAFGLLVCWLFGPWSPDAAERPALIVALGFPNLGLASYEGLATGLAPESTQGEVLWRAANLAATDLDDRQHAIELLRRLVAEHPAHPRVPEALDMLGTLYERAMDDPLRAGESWAAAAQAAPDAPEAGPRWLRAGEAYTRARQPEHAEAALKAATGFTGVAVDAWLALGDLRIKPDPAGALVAYQAALSAGAKGRRASLAHLGVATALERQDKKDEALQELQGTVAVGDGDDAIRQRIKLLQESDAQ